MKIKDSVIVSKVNDQYVLVDSDASDERFNGLVKLNETGKDIFEALMEYGDKEKAVSRLLEIYDTDKEHLEKDTDRLIEELERAGLVY